MISATTVIWTGLLGSSVSALIAVIGVHIGSRLSLRNERQKDSRARETALRAERASIYTEALSLIRKAHQTLTIIEKCRSAAIADPPVKIAGDIDPKTAIAEFSENFHAMWTTQTRLMLLAGKSVSGAYADYMSNLGPAMRIIGKSAALPNDEYLTTLEVSAAKLNSAEFDFIRVARADLAVEF